MIGPNDRLCVFDVEADGINPSKIHCLTAAVYSMGEWRIKSTTDYDEMRKFFMSSDVLVGHNIYRWDIPVVQRLLGIKVTAQIVDTLALSWYLYPTQGKHGLESWGEYFGVPKPKVDDWDNLPIEEYIHRCEEDVKINCKLWDKQLSNLCTLYGSKVKKDKAYRFIDYLMFKMETAAKAEASRWKLDVERCEEGLKILEADVEEKVNKLTLAMPKTPITRTKSKPKNMKKKDGTLSKAATDWYGLLADEGLEPDHSEDVTFVYGYKEPNPNSTKQIKDWLESLGWKPESFNYIGERMVPQVRVDIKGEKLLCPSVQKLLDKEPALENLEGITLMNHRIGILKGFLSNMDDEGYLQASISGITNTLRFRHKTIVNLPAASRPYGELVRGVLIAPEGYELCGSDMSSLEDRTKQHYMWKHDPEYVKEMQVDDFDPHLALAEFAGALTPEQVKAHKDGTENHSGARHLYKTANYSCTYGAGGGTLARTLDISKKEGDGIVKAYREKNWAIGAIAKDCVTKKALGVEWLFNPVSKFWYSLRSEKDKFSTLNQGTGVYCFDMWIKNFFDSRPQITGQMHDEVILCVKKGYRDQCTKLLKDAVYKVNEQLNLNRDLDVDVQFGLNYAQIH